MRPEANGVGLRRAGGFFYKLVGQTGMLTGELDGGLPMVEIRLTSRKRLKCGRGWYQRVLARRTCA